MPKYTHELFLGYHNSEQLNSLWRELKEHKKEEGWERFTYFAMPPLILVVIYGWGKPESWVRDTLGRILAIASKHDGIKEELQVGYRFTDGDKYTIREEGIACEYGLGILDQ